MTPEQRREQAEKEVREKLGWWVQADYLNFADGRYRTASQQKIDAYNLLVSQTIALSEAQERIAELVGGDGIYYIPQERAFAPGIAGVLPDVVLIPKNKNARLVKRVAAKGE